MVYAEDLLNVIYVESVKDMESQKVNVIVKVMFLTVKVSVVENLFLMNVVFVMVKESVKEIVIVLVALLTVMVFVVVILHMMPVVSAEEMVFQRASVIVTTTN